MYNRYGIQTKAVTASEFVDNINHRIRKKYAIKDFFKSINDAIQKGYVDRIEKYNRDDYDLSIYKIEPSLPAYFNYLYLKCYKNGQVEQILHRDSKFFRPLFSIKKPNQS